jgi:hypothetical protein
MGISLKDLGNFAVGAIERDREITKENLAIRADELKANRDFLIEQKKKKYEREIDEYYKEKEKFDTINEANKMYDLKSIDARTYATRVLPITTPGWDKLTDTQKEDAVNDFKGKTFDYKLVGNEDEIRKQAALINNQINSVTAEEIKNAKGNSFLINKIIGEKKKAEADLLKEVEDKIKATDAIKLSEQEVDQEYVGKDVRVSTPVEDSPFYISPDERKTNQYKKFYEVNINQAKALKDFNAQRKSADNNLVIKKSATELGITNLKDYFTVDADNRISAFKGSGESFANTQFSQSKMYKDFLIGPGNDYLYVSLDKDATKLIPYYDKENLNGALANRTKDYAVPLSSGAILGEGGKLNFSTILRNEDNLIVIPTANTIDFDNSIKGTNKILSDSEKNKVKTIYANVLKDLSSIDGQFNPQLLKQNQARLEDLRYNDTSNNLLATVNYRFNSELLKEGIITQDQFNNLYGKKDIKPTETITVTINGETKTLIDNETTQAFIENQKKLGKEVTVGVVTQGGDSPEKNKPIEQVGGDGSIAESIAGVNENTIKKITPDNPNQPVFETLESVQKILPYPMTGQEIKDKYEIGFKINPRSKFLPIK